MNILSPYLVAILLGWVVAQGLKYGFAVAKTGSLRQLRQLYLSGNMPSSHAASVMALATVIGLKDGVESAVFAVAALFAAIVMYDAMMVRRSSGEQGNAIQMLIKEQKSKVSLPRAAKGHTPLEVVVGAVLGACIGCVVFFATI
ncbi:MAG TPA: divergent PAP2 family protein [Candidatus Saccharimonadales bacterium]